MPAMICASAGSPATALSTHCCQARASSSRPAPILPRVRCYRAANSSGSPSSSSRRSLGERGRGGGDDAAARLVGQPLEG